MGSLWSGGKKGVAIWISALEQGLPSSAGASGGGGFYLGCLLIGPAMENLTDRPFSV